MPRQDLKMDLIVLEVNVMKFFFSDDKVETISLTLLNCVVVAFGHLILIV